MRGEITRASFAKRHLLDWYVDEPWCALQLLQALGYFAEEKAAGEAIWDPCAGYGNTLHWFAAHGHNCVASDVVDNFNHAQFDDPETRAPFFFSADFLREKHALRRCSIVCNPPYSYRKGISEDFVRHALKLTSRRVCVLVPNKWLSSQARFRLFALDHPPQAVLHLTQRPSMPPGDRIALMGKRAFNGGMIDYCWIVWDVTQPTPRGETHVLWLPPLAGEGA